MCLPTYSTYTSDIFHTLTAGVVFKGISVDVVLIGIRNSSRKLTFRIKVIVLVVIALFVAVVVIVIFVVIARVVVIVEVVVAKTVVNFFSCTKIKSHSSRSN